MVRYKDGQPCSGRQIAAAARSGSGAVEADVVGHRPALLLRFVANLAVQWVPYQSTRLGHRSHASAASCSASALSFSVSPSSICTMVTLTPPGVASDVRTSHGTPLRISTKTSIGALMVVPSFLG